jgi:hypothetical protein
MKACAAPTSSRSGRRRDPPQRSKRVGPDEITGRLGIENVERQAHGVDGGVGVLDGVPGREQRRRQLSGLVR